MHTASETFPTPGPPGETALRRAGCFWFLVALLGQWLFAFYIVRAYGVPVLEQNLEAVNDAPKITGYVPGDCLGNVFMLAHILLAAVLSFGGFIQLVPWLRRRAAWLHRWNGRLFLSISFFGAASGLALTWLRGSRLSDLGALGVSVNGILILGAVIITWRLARAGNYAAHGRWAIRTFLLVSGVWFFRLGLFGWLMANQGPAGNSPKLDGPADIAISFGSYLLPLAVAELYFRARESHRPGLKRLAAGVLSIATLAMGFGIFAAFMILWLPRL